MGLLNTNPTTTKSWVKLQKHFDEIHTKEMKVWFQENPDRAEELSIEIEDIYLDYSKNRITSETMSLLYNLAEEVGLKAAIEAQFKGMQINKTEERSVLHTALRGGEELEVNGIPIHKEITDSLSKIKGFSSKIHSGKWKGYTGKPIDTVVNIGIGGSDLGPKMVVDALLYYKSSIKSHFISNVDGDHVHHILQQLDPETTLFIVVSKSFATQETLANAETSRAWFLEHAAEKDIAKHFVAVSTNIKAIKTFGIATENTFPLWDWVGGRFSLWSSVGLSIACVLGYDHFEELLAGAFSMDEHFRKTSFENNIPVTLALISVWYNNFFNSETEAIIPYNQALNSLVPYLQQAIMESNGKHIDREGNPVSYETGTIVWGSTGTNAQHAFFQLLHQGTKFIPADFIGFKQSFYNDKSHDFKLMSNFFAQTEALLVGKTKEEVRESLEQQNMPTTKLESVVAYKSFTGNRPTNTLLFSKLTPKVLGKLIAMYEHKLFVQGVIWNIFSYDQMGVELGKELSSSLLQEIQSSSVKSEHDASTKILLDTYLQAQ